MPKASRFIGTIFIIIAALIALRAASSIFSGVHVEVSERTFTIEQGESVKQITASLNEADSIKSAFWFRIWVWLRSKEGSFIAGTFDLPEKISTAALVQLLTTSAQQEVKTIKILEGWGIRDIAQYFESLGMFQQEELTELVGLEAVYNSFDTSFYNELAFEYPIVLKKQAGAPLEGYLFPDTYEIFSDASMKDIVRKMVANFDKKVTQELRDEIARQGKNFYAVLTMASIIEAEVPSEADRAIVSDIFWSRLESGVALQSDATLNYRISGTSPALTFEQLKINTEYNTYMYNILPPTPIGNPGISAIRAAIYPAETDFFYFLSTPEGETIFSRTLEEHNAAKNRYLR